MWQLINASVPTNINVTVETVITGYTYCLPVPGDCACKAIAFQPGATPSCPNSGFAVSWNCGTYMWAAYLRIVITVCYANSPPVVSATCLWTGAGGALGFPAYCS